MDWTGGETIVTVTFVEADGRTTATTAVLYSSQQARDAAAKTPMTTGMETSYRRLDELLADPGI